LPADKPRAASGVEQRWRAFGDDALATSVIVEVEVLYGIELKQSACLLALYDQLLLRNWKAPTLTLVEVLRR
jgi:predicted nucleic acid-binding protein